jgi:hypothetical protein
MVFDDLLIALSCRNGDDKFSALSRESVEQISQGRVNLGLVRFGDPADQRGDCRGRVWQVLRPSRGSC